jgi:hypothetical protein
VLTSREKGEIFVRKFSKQLRIVLVSLFFIVFLAGTTAAADRAKYIFMFIGD